jgi:beta-glucanase (GH16 family)
MNRPALNWVRIAAMLLGTAGLQAAACAETILFVGNSFTFGGESPPVQAYRPETVTDLNHEGIGGVPALFKCFTREAGLAYEVSLETAPGMNLDFHFEQKAALIAQAWDHVVLQGYSTLDADAPGDAGKIIDYSARLAELFHTANPQVDVRLVATWSRADQTYLASGHWFGKPIETMAFDVRAAYDRAAEHSGHIRAVIPVGQAWNRAIGQGIAVRNPYQAIGPGQINLWAADNYHASVYGYYLEALVIFGSVTGHDPRGLGRKEQAAAQLGISPAQAVTLQRIAFETLASERATTVIPATVDPTPIGKWNLVVAASDEFDGITLDAAKWKKGLWYDTSGVLAFGQENIAVSGGNLVLTARKDAFNEKSYTGGAVESLFDVPGVNGYVEVRAKALHRNANVLSAIWLQSSPLTLADNPNPEIDIQETFNYDGVVSTLHTWAIGPETPAPTAQDEYIHTQTAPNEFKTGVDVSADYHVYGLERSHGKLRFYFDGKLAWEVVPSDPSFVNMPRHVVLSLEGHLGEPVDRYLPQSFLIDYVRTYIPVAD